jgi:hypothetical protein
VVISLAAVAACQGEPRVEPHLSAAVSPEPFLESGGQVVMEAENATGVAPGTGAAAGATWTVRSVTTASAGLSLEATPNAGVHTGDTIIGPRRDYTVRFATPGTYQVWVRAWGPVASDDSLHVGLDGTPASLGSSGVLGPGTTWAWVNLVGSRRLTVTVGSAGLHTLNVWMREDGVRFDKVLLTTSASFTPSGAGPAESPRDSQPPPADAAAPPPADAGQAPMDAAHHPMDVAQSPMDAHHPTPDSGPPPQDAAAPPADASPPPTQTAFLESSGQVVMEAENGTGAATGSGIAAGAIWTARAVATASGGTALEATPNAGVRTGESTVGPRRDYRVRFATAGTYQLWVRARGPSSSDDTIHAGFNGTPVTLGESGLLVPSGWTWVNRVGARRVTVTVSSPGLATINVWMREDGVFVDKILLTTAASFTPSGTGPAESPREGVSPPPPPPPPSGQGQWSPVVMWQAEAVHAHLLPNGKVLTFPYGDHGADDPYLWDPATNVFTPMPNMRTNVGCSGHAFFPDGRLLVAGGEPHTDHTGNGIVDTNIFDYRTNTWTPAPDMNAARWYPNVTTLANGEMAVITGDMTTDVGNPIPQVLTAAGTWRTLSTAHRVLPSYSFTFLAPDGRVFVSGSERHSVYLDTRGTGAWSEIVASTSFTRIRSYGSSVMYDNGKVMVVGGGDPPTNTVEVIDLNQAPPRWRTVAPMSVARRQLNATLLPDGRVLVTGGTSGAGHNNAAGAVLHSEIWDPTTETWTRVAAKEVPSLYHSVALLLPDGRVMASPGRGFGPSPNEERRDTQYYSPDYLFRGARPAISSTPATVGYGQTFFVGTAQAASIRRVTWIRLPSVTHAIDMNQRINRLSFTTASGGLNVTAPSNRNLCPPGHYMLFILDDQGVPSVARIVQIL